MPLKANGPRRRNNRRALEAHVAEWQEQSSRSLQCDMKQISDGCIVKLPGGLLVSCKYMSEA